MVSGTSTTPLTAEGEIGGVNQSQHQQPQKQNPNFCMAVPGFGSGSGGPAPVAASAVPAGGCPSASVNTGSSSDDLSKKIRKPYTITKSRESWTEQEHDKFLEALQLFDRDWKKIEAFVGSKTVIQIRSHAQKYFLKVQKNGTSEHVPPPRPKRKAAHPYPQKASKIVPPFSQIPLPCQASPSLVEPRYATRTDPSSVLRNSTTGATAASWTQNSVPPHTAPESSAKDDIGLTGSLGPNNSCSSSDSPSGLWPTSEATDQANHAANHAPSHHVMPDFAQVYGFIGSVFDPNTSGHLQKLKEMDPIDVQTVLLLMRNLAINLRSPDFEDHRTLLSSYGSEEAKSFCTRESFHSSEVTNTPIGMKSE